MIDGVVFDKDGTLFDFRASWGGWVQRLLGQIAVDDAHADALAVAMGYDRETQDFVRTSPVIAGTAMDISAVLLPLMPGMDQVGLAAVLNACAQDAVMAPAVPLRPVLAALRARGLQLGLATNDSEGPARAHLNAHGIADLFDFIAGFDSGHGAKPGPGMCLAFARTTGLAPARVVMVGDSLHDLEAGRAAGMRTAAVLTGIAVAADLAPHADVVLPDIGHLGAWIDSLR
ncbi:phosphoglycolate phosphatase [Pseudorhodobacter antarcticus]|jgi:phosphoglycolate phosphatase|uniref:phosphoglycolate phosphatase n=1 Tax=Pseudorhodobacter antarcticus TaxID=1077947 RepID=A0A1H8F6U2_9RHOB|nr:HAD family hydrolase [Pseudorhodobacter antarcticus]SEN27442.1 phosphoglycolate phosphatase [Pseudorhodobacter antarcticus]